MEHSKLGVIGGGTMGNGIAHLFAQHGHPTVLVDVDEAALARARAAIEGNLARQVKKGTLGEDLRQATLGRLTCTTDVTKLAGCALVVEAVYEDERAKQAVYQKIDRVLAQDTILATNTSSISVTRLAAATSRAERFIGMHFMNPVPMMKLVEVIRGHNTSDATTAQVMELAKTLDKVPVEVNDYPGFVSNRVLMPMINEAIFCLFEGVATAPAIDEVMKLGMAHPMGPLALADFIGLDVCLSILDVLFAGFGDTKYRACPLLRRMVAAGHLGRKCGRGFYDYKQS